MRSDRERLLDIREAIARIERYSQGGRLGVEGNELVLDAILRHLQIIGEVIERDLPDLKAKIAAILRELGSGEANF